MKNIYDSKANPLKWLEVFQYDKGNEFKVYVTKLPEAHNIRINSVITKYKHTGPTFAKSFNKRLAEKLFMIMDAKDIKTGEDSDKWMKNVLSGAVI